MKPGFGKGQVPSDIFFKTHLVLQENLLDLLQDLIRTLLLIMSRDLSERLPGRLLCEERSSRPFFLYDKLLAKRPLSFVLFLWKVGGGRKCWLICQPDFEINTCWHFPFSPGKIASVVCCKMLGWKDHFFVIVVMPGQWHCCHLIV